MKRLLLVSIVFCIAPLSAQAHLVQTGFGGFYDGVAHLVISPSDVMIVIALALLSGINGPACGRIVAWALPGFWLLGGIIGLAVPYPPVLALLASVIFGVVGLLVALNLQVSRSVFLTLCGGCGLLYGFGDAATLETETTQRWLELLGITVTVLVLSTVLSATVISLRPNWTRIAVRVAGSWLAAIGMLMLGWAARGKFHS